MADKKRSTPPDEAMMLQPTRKVGAMTALLAEHLLQEQEDHDRSGPRRIDRERASEAPPAQPARRSDPGVALGRARSPRAAVMIALAVGVVLGAAVAILAFAR